MLLCDVVGVVGVDSSYVKNQFVGPSRVVTR